MLYHKNGNLYFGLSNKYSIKKTDLEGKELLHLGLKRKRIKVSSAFKDEVVLDLNFPPEVKKIAKKNLPDYLNYFEKIYVDNKGLIYVFEPVYENKNLQRVDIFSGDGKYVYASEIKVEKGYEIDGFHLAGNNIYLVLEDENGEIKIAKYHFTAPTPPWR